MSQGLVTPEKDPWPRAVFSRDRRYRYMLYRRIEGNPPNKICLFVCLNPSTADETHDDPTVRLCIGFAREWGFGAMVLVNVFAYRSTDPKRLYTMADPIGSRNDAWIALAAGRASRIVVAWGNHGAHRGRGDQVLEMLLELNPTVMRFGLTKTGQPRHPLRMKKTQPLVLLER